MSEEEQLAAPEEAVVEEVVSEAGVTPDVEAAPAEAEPAPSVADVEVEPAPADDSPSADSGEGTPASISSAEEFGWDKWDGSDESLPEDVRSWAKQIQSYYAAQNVSALEAQKQRLDETKRIYDALLGGQEDPRIDEYQQKATEWETKYSERAAQLEQIQQEYANYQKAINEAIDQEADEYAKWFKSEYKDLFTDEKLETTFYGLVDEGWDLEFAAKATRLSPETLDRARKAKADGVPDAYALRFAVERAPKRSQAPRPGARITAGATTPSRVPEQTSIVESTALSMKDLRGHVARSALKKHRS